MPKGKFTKEQNTHIESFMPDFVKELERGVDGTGLTRWKQSTASNILDSPLFLSLDMVAVPRKTWFEFSSIRSGRQLFAEENEGAGAYQTVLKQQWDSLTEEEQSGWNERAELEAGDVSQNQQEFATTMTLALRDLCQSQLLGDTEMVLFYAIRQPDTGDLLARTIHGHCVANQQNFGGTAEELDMQYGQLWSEFAEDVILRSIAVNSLIPRNSSGQPVFPSINIDTVPIADLRTLLGEYFEQCWSEVCRPAGQKIKSIPWAEIVSNPGKYYDTEGHSFPIALAHPQNLSTIGVITIAQVLLSTSVINSPTPFRFLEDKETVLVPPTPVTSTIPTILPPPVIQAPQAPPVSEAQPPLSSSPPSPTMTEGPERPQSQTSNKCSVIEKNTESAPVPQARRQSARARNKPSVSSSAPKAKDTSARGKKKPKWPGYATVDSDGNDISDSD
ncbi:hypothetical protein B0H10DRAFT_1947089 [Mycena sp. CBHHK59/15]|nr:hypothetical protein B0H10DRAFT_1947089 [Mycena sp. CBHHK59/15]